LAAPDFDIAEAYFRWASDHPDLAAELPTNMIPMARFGLSNGLPNPFVRYWLSSRHRT
jgi:hypothetical protein